VEKRWEYKIVTDIATPDIIENALNDLGKDGWRFVSFLGRNSLMEREIHEEQAPEPLTNDPKVDAIQRIINKRGSFEYYAMVEAIQKIITSDSTEAQSIVDKYYEETSPTPIENSPTDFDDQVGD
jgi:hypothetical protein